MIFILFFNYTNVKECCQQYSHSDNVYIMLNYTTDNNLLISTEVHAMVYIIIFGL